MSETLGCNTQGKFYHVFNSILYMYVELPGKKKLYKISYRKKLCFRKTSSWKIKFQEPFGLSFDDTK